MDYSESVATNGTKPSDWAVVNEAVSQRLGPRPNNPRQAQCPLCSRPYTSGYLFVHLAVLHSSQLTNERLMSGTAKGWLWSPSDPCECVCRKDGISTIGEIADHILSLSGDELLEHQVMLAMGCRIQHSAPTKTAQVV